MNKIVNRMIDRDEDEDLIIIYVNNKDTEN